MTKGSWDHYRRYRRWFHLMWLGAFTVCVAAAIVSAPHLGPVGKKFVFAAGPLLLFVWLVAALSTGFEFFQHFKCPKCGGRFFARESYPGTLRGRCAQCGLPKWSEPPA